MAWTQTGSLRGPAGLQGLPGRGVASTVINGAGELEITFTDATSINLGVVKGLNGADGTSVTIAGSVADAASLPTDLVLADKGDGYITSDTGHLHVWDGTAFVDVGNITGPAGPQGNTGPQGPRGTTWFTGNGAPAEDIPGSQLGDLYLDLDTGALYALA